MLRVIKESQANGEIMRKHKAHRIQLLCKANTDEAQTMQQQLLELVTVMSPHLY